MLSFTENKLYEKDKIGIYLSYTICIVLPITLFRVWD